MLSKLDRGERLRLMKFICSFAWADLEVQPEERIFIGHMIRRLELEPDEMAQVQSWLEVPPEPDEVDPADIPRSHRRLFFDTLHELVKADGTIDAEESTSLSLLAALLEE